MWWTTTPVSKITTFRAAIRRSLVMWNIQTLRFESPKSWCWKFSSRTFSEWTEMWSGNVQSYLILLRDLIRFPLLLHPALHGPFYWFMNKLNGPWSLSKDWIDPSLIVKWLAMINSENYLGLTFLLQHYSQTNFSSLWINRTNIFFTDKICNCFKILTINREINIYTNRS